MNLLRSLSVAAAAAVIIACGNDPFAAKPDLDTLTDTLTVFALSGTPNAVPTAVNTGIPAAVRAEAGTGFEVVFDINSAGKVVLLPQQLIATTGKTGMQKVAGGFDDLLLAPAASYDETHAQTVSFGETVVVRAAAAICSVNSLRPYLYSKIVVDSIKPQPRTIFFRIRVDRNCGFRSFKPGLPTE